MPATPAILRARAVHTAARLLEYSNITATVIDRTEGDAQPDIANPVARIAVDHGALSLLPKRLRATQERARATTDLRPLVLVQSYESGASRGDLLAVLTLADLARLIGAVEDSRVPA